MRFSSLLCPGALVLAILVGPGGSLPAQAQQQDVPDAVQDELDARNLTPEQARRRARQLGIDLSDPKRVVRQAHRRGVPEARVQALLQAVQREEEPDTTAQS